LKHAVLINTNPCYAYYHLFVLDHELYPLIIQTISVDTRYIFVLDHELSPLIIYVQSISDDIHILYVYIYRSFMHFLTGVCAIIGGVFTGKYRIKIRGRRGHDHMVVGFTMTYTISAYHH
jgi:hypothetical protein